MAEPYFLSRHFEPHRTAPEPFQLTSPPYALPRVTPSPALLQEQQWVMLDRNLNPSLYDWLTAQVRPLSV